MTTDAIDANPTSRGAAGLEIAKDRARQLSGAFDPRQRTIMAVVFAATIGAVLAFSYLSSRTDWAPLMTDLTASDAEAVTSQLESSGTKYRLADGGATIEVPADVLYQTRIDVASVDMPSSGKVGYGILDDQGVTSSEFSQRIGFQRAMEGELGRTIEAIDGVNAATVHLALPKSDTFALDDQKATASVMVSTGQGRTLAGRQVQAIVNLVSGAIEGLSPKDVTVADAAGRVLAAPGATPGGASGDNEELQANFEQGLSTSIEDMLGSIVGPGNAKVTVAADLDFDSTQSVSETYSAPTTLVEGQPLAVNEVTKTETYNGTGTGADTQGVLGPDGVADAAANAAAGSGYELNERQVNNAVNKVVENTNRAPGAVERLSVAVVVNEEVVDATQLPELQTIVSAAAGISADRGDTIAVSRFPLDTSEQEQIAEELAFRERQAKAEAAAAGMPTWALAAGGVVLVVLLVLGLRARKRRRSAVLDPEVLELGSGDSVADRVITVEAHPREQPLDLTAAELAVAPGTDHHPDRREALGDLIDNQPDEVAQLLRSWLGDRREVAR